MSYVTVYIVRDEMDSIDIETENWSSLSEAASYLTERMAADNEDGIEIKLAMISSVSDA